MLRSPASYPLQTLLLAGGRGERLKSVTGGLIPKCFVEIDPSTGARGIDHLHEVFEEVGMYDAIFSADHYYAQYASFVRGTAYRMLYQRPGGTAIAIEQAIEQFGIRMQYLVISPDTYVEAADIRTLINSHKPGTVSWGVSEYTDEMEPYFGLVVEEESLAIVGDTQLSGTPAGIEHVREYVKGAIHLIDPTIFLRTLRAHRTLTPRKPHTDFYWDICPLLEEQNRRRVVRGRASILQAIPFAHAILDYGTPERLSFLRHSLSHQPHA